VERTAAGACVSCEGGGQRTAVGAGTAVGEQGQGSAAKAPGRGRRWEQGRLGEQGGLLGFLGFPRFPEIPTLGFLGVPEIPRVS
jgi:hypothetical protein